MRRNNDKWLWRAAVLWIPLSVGFWVLINYLVD